MTLPIDGERSASARWPALNLDNRERSDNSHGEPLPTSYDDPEYQKGWTDGRVGAKSPNQRQIFELIATQRRDDVLVALQKSYELAGAEERIARSRSERTRRDSDFAETALDEISRHRTENPSQHSWPLGLVYCLVALILWIADLPLSLLAADGLDIRTDYAALADLSFVRSGWTQLWEPLAFAIGIAALGLFFKFVADFFFKPRLRTHLLFKILSVVLLVGVVGLVMWNLYFLAQLRASVKGLHEAQRRATVTNIAPADLSVLNQQMQQRAGVSFVLLTLTLPIIGGICASAGWSRLQNAWARSALRRAQRRLRITLEEAVRQEQNAAAAARSVFKELEIARGSSSTLAVDAALALYEDGFRRGFLVPETIHNGRRFHERVEFAVGRWLAIAQRRVAENDLHRTEVAK